MATVRSHVFVVRDGRILALQQAQGWRWWELPGGGLEIGEDAAQAAVRETLEEAGLSIDAPELLRAWSYRNSRDCEVPCYAYAASALSGDVRLSDEHSAYEWMTIDAYVERSCAELITAASPPFARLFLAGIRENCFLFREWLRIRGA